MSTQARELELLNVFAIINEYGYWKQPCDAVLGIYQKECQCGKGGSQISILLGNSYWPCKGQGVKNDQNVIIEWPKI